MSDAAQHQEEQTDRLMREVMGYLGTAPARGWEWDPYRDPAADAEVLKRVQDVWRPKGTDVFNFTYFVNALGALAAERWREDKSGPPSLAPTACRVLYYRTGDYARAALMVLDVIRKETEVES